MGFALITLKAMRDEINHCLIIDVAPVLPAAIFKSGANLLEDDIDHSAAGRETAHFYQRPPACRLIFATTR